MTTIIQQHISSKLCNDMAEIGLTKEQVNLIRDLSSCMCLELEIFVKMALEEYMQILLENYERIGRSAREGIVKKYANIVIPIRHSGTLEPEGQLQGKK